MQKGPDNMGELNWFEKEIKIKGTRFFVIDTFLQGSLIVDHNDVDFKEYRWNIKFNNKIRQGDLFIYRRPQRNSEYQDGRFYLFGAGKFGEINFLNNEQTLVVSKIEKPMTFRKLIFENELEKFNWHFKEYKGTWRGFFTQYGITEISKMDFVELLMLQEKEKTLDYVMLSEEEEKIAVEIYQQQQLGNYCVEDRVRNVKTRGAAQKVFADRVKAYYKHVCAITGMSQKEFLVASHIVPWKDDHNNRTNPQNGICLSVLCDRAFDQGYITFLDDGKMIISEYAKRDKVLFEYLKQYEGVKINMKMLMSPNVEFLKWHREHVFKQ